MEELENLKIDQLGFVYKDVEKQAKIMEGFPGAKKFVIFQPIDVNVIYRGVEKTIKMKSAFGRVFDTELELLQPVEGYSIYNEFLDQGKEGFHHIGYKIENFDEIVNNYKSESIKILQSGKLVRLKYAYMDTEETMGTIIEFIQESIRKKRKKLIK
ncbi:MAG: VOC family protein [Promethearchaeota archaeon]